MKWLIIISAFLFNSSLMAKDWVYFPDGTEIKKEAWMLANEQKAQFYVDSKKLTAERGMCDFIVRQDKTGKVQTVEPVGCFPDVTPEFSRILSQAIYTASPFTPPQAFKDTFVITLRAK